MNTLHSVQELCDLIDETTRLHQRLLEISVRRAELVYGIPRGSEMKIQWEGKTAMGVAEYRGDYRGMPARLLVKFMDRGVEIRLDPEALHATVAIAGLKGTGGCQSNENMLH